MKPNRHKPLFCNLIPKAAFGIAGGLMLVMAISACQFDPASSSLSAESVGASVPQGTVSQPLPSLVVSSSQASQNSQESSQISSVLSSQVSSSKDSASSSAASKPLSSAVVKPVSSAPKPESSTPVSSSKPASSSSSVTAPASKPTTKPASSARDRVFDDAVFVGNSFLEDLYTYGGAGNADFYYRVGLTVRSVFTKSTAKGKVPVIDELKGKSYGKVLLIFGENELGWSAEGAFAKDYGKVIDAVRQRQPNATIYVHSIFPVSKSVSDRNEDNANNARIREYNSQLKTVAAQKGAVYLDVASMLQDSSGNLPNGAAPDGIHLNRTYCMKWLDYLRQNL